MVDQKIKNPELPINKTSAMNDLDFITDILSTEKYMTVSYCTALNEFSHDELYQEISAIFNESQDCQREIYNLMFKKGFYGIEAQDSNKLQQSYEQFQGYMNQFPTH
ncbi:spore coat protein [Priestia endophytica]|uniref:spore coat protein n=1 Tax=Priestia endophytica TaxID=135735 RepID=UPI00227DE5B0|nr:spore coat protein [Priestia endophytica]MCY8231529.1 spore coat protein [Priestia endophytica]